MNILNDILYPAIDDFNEELPEDQPLAKTEDTALFGGSASLNSIQLVSFIVCVEEMIQDEMGKEIELANDKAMSRRSSPFRNISTLASYIEELIATE